MLRPALIARPLLYPRYLLGLRDHPARPGDAEVLWLEHAQQRVEVWFLQGHGVSAARPGPALIFAHGNGELIDDWPALLEPYRQLGLSVVLPEYRGYGRTRGTPNERGIVRDFEAVLDALAADPRVDPQRLVYHGRSLGGGVVCALTERRAPAALVLESTFTSVTAVARDLGVPAGLSKLVLEDRYDSLQAVRSYPGPLLVMHGSRDTLIPLRHGEQLAAASPRAKLVVYEAGHNDLPPPPSRAHYWAEIRATLRGAFGEELGATRGAG